MATGCKGTNAAGNPCQAMPLKGKDYCAWHDESLAGQRRAWSVAGGRNKSNDARARKRVLTSGLELAEIDSALCAALLDVLSGQLEPGIATAAAGVARSIATIRTASDLEARITALESQRGGRTA